MEMLSRSPPPSEAFHTPNQRPYHASRRPSASPHALSPRVTGGSVITRRFDLPPKIKASITASSPPVPFFAPSPKGNKTYVDAGTQYTPPGFRPTPRSPPKIELKDLVQSKTQERDNCDLSTVSAPAIALVEQRESSAARVITESTESLVRAPAQPSTPRQHVPIPSQSPSKENMRLAEQETALVKESTVLQVASSSPVKRARAQETEVHIMPLQYEACNVKDLGVLISDMLMELVRLNDGYPLRDGTLTRFHSRAPPGISVRDYLSRLIVHATLSPPILLSMVFYVDKLCAMYPAFTISSLTVHRFLITAATVAAKGLSDSFWTNSLYARVGGVSVRELALLELEFLRRLEWRIVPKPEVLVDYYKGLVERGAGFAMEREGEMESGNITNQPQSPTGSATGIHTNRSTT